MKKPSQKKPLTLWLIALAALSLIGYFSYQLLSSRPTIALLGPACTKDVMMCPDGSRVGRSGPGCDFICPNANVETTSACTKDAKICPNGRAVGRTGPNCEFEECAPNPEANPQILFSPINPIVSDTTPQTIQLLVEPNNYRVTGSEVELAYDQSTITIDQVEPSSYFPVVLSQAQINNGKVNFVYGISPETSVQLQKIKPMTMDAASSFTAEQGFGGNTGICGSQITGMCIGKDGISCVNYTNLCERSAVCALPIQACGKSTTFPNKLTLPLATITYHTNLALTNQAQSTPMTITRNSQISAFESETNLLLSYSTVSITLQSSYKPGDLNGNNTVDLFDFNLLIAKFNNPYTIFDFNAIIANYGVTYSQVGPH
jgi:hypothetical protein